MKISLKIFLGYFLLVGLAAWFVLYIFVDEVKPGVRQAMEDTLVDSANVLAELAVNDVKTNNIQTGTFAQSLAKYQAHATKANIWGIKKQSADYRVYITDIKGNALLMGSLLVFGLLAVTMIVTRKVDWYQISVKEAVEQNAGYYKT